MMLVNPRVDIAFKKIFGVEENKDILMSLLNAIVTEEDQMDDIELLNPYNERNFKGDKLSILDVKARNKHTKTYFLVEMQIADEMQYHKRSLYSWARMYANQLGTGQHYRRGVENQSISSIKERDQPEFKTGVFMLSRYFAEKIRWDSSMGG